MGDSPMECGGNDAALAGDAPGSVPEDAPSPEGVEEGEFPEGWQRIALSEVVIKARQTNPLAQPEREFTYVDVSSISRDALSITKTSRILGKDAPSRARKLIRAGDVIFATVRPSLRRVAAVPPELDGQVCSTAFCVIRANPQTADPGFLFFATAFEDFVKRVTEHERGSSYPAVTDGQVLAERIPLPPVPEQRAIAVVLRTVQGAKEACERVLAATRQLKQSLLHHLFTYGPVPFTQAAHVLLKETEIGPVPEHWSVVSIGDIETFMQYGTSSRCESGGSGLPVLRIPNVVGGRIDTADLKYLAASPTEIERHLLQRGDLLFVRTNGVRENVGRCAVYLGSPTRSLFASYLIRARLAPDRALPEFVQLFTETNTGQASFTGRASGAADGKFNINTQIIRSTILPLPPLSEQREIAAQLATVDAKLAEEESRRSALAALFQSLLHHLMTGKVRVPLECGGKQSATPLSPST